MTATATRVTEELGKYVVALRRDQIPEAVSQRAKDLFLDFLGVGLGGLQADSTGPVLTAILALQGGASGPSTVLGQRAGAPSHFAALANATLAHSMDFDDTYAESIMHVGAPLFATLLALGEETGVSGQEFLTAAVAGYDVAAKLGKVHKHSVHQRGFHPTATTGIFACTAAGGRLLGLGEDQVLNAMGLNVSQAAGSQQFLENGAWNKRLHVGLAAHNAIYSLAFAREGFRGAAEPIEGRFGYLNLYCQDGYDLDEALRGLGETFEVMATATKPYPCCRYNHAPIDAVLALTRQHRLGPSDIGAIDVYLSATAYPIVAEPPEDKRRPSNLVEGQFSVFFAAAEAALREKYDWEAYERLGHPELEKMMDRVDVHVDDRLSGFQGRVEITTVSGQRLALEVGSPRGEPDNPMTSDEIAEKFRSLAADVLDHEQVEAVIAAIDALEDLQSISEVTRHLRTARAT